MLFARLRNRSRPSKQKKREGETKNEKQKQKLLGACKLLPNLANVLSTQKHERKGVMMIIIIIQSKPEKTKSDTIMCRI